MSAEIDNLFDIPDEHLGDDEVFEVLARGENMRVERIISRGHITPDEQWYDQAEDEWVALLQGRATLAWDDGTTTDLWLAVHAKMTPQR
jgi:cupin 2 domain-containing protein